MKTWKIFTAIFSIIFLCPVHFSSACYDEYSDESSWVSFFMPDISGAESLMPFYYSGYSLYRTDSLWPNCSRKQNDKEWQSYLNGKVSLEAIDSILYKADPVPIVNTIDSMRAGSGSDTAYMSHNSLITYLVKSQKNQIIDYLIYAKSIEDYILKTDPWVERHRWSDDEPVQQFEKLKTAVKQGYKCYQQASDSFLKARYAYQCIKIYGNMHHSDSMTAPDSCIHLYDNTFGRWGDKSVLKYWALYFKAISIKNDLAQRDYLLSLVFDHTDEKEEAIMIFFDPKILDQILAKAQNNHEKAVILIMAAMQSSGPVLPMLERIYDLDPDNDKLGMLLARELNKLEEWVMMPSIHDNPYQWSTDGTQSYFQNLQKDEKYMSRLSGFVSCVAQAHRTHDAGLWDVANGYIYFMQDNFLKAGLWYAKAEKESNSLNVNLQIHLSKVLLAIAENKAVTPAFEQKMDDALAWMESNPRKMTYGYQKNLLLYLANRYEALHDVGKKALVLFKCRSMANSDPYPYLDQTAKPKDYDEIIALLRKKNKTPFEAYLTSERLTAPKMDVYDENLTDDRYFTKPNISMLLDHKGTWLVNHGRLKEALAVFKQIPDTLWQSRPYKAYMNCNPFFVNRWQTHAEHKADSIRYNKVTFLTRLLKLQNRVALGKGNLARNCFLLGNAYYSMSYYGNFWMMNAYYSSVEEMSKDTKHNLFGSNYYGCQQAMEYYLKAAQNAQQPRFKALCLIMAEECHKNHTDYLNHKITYPNNRITDHAHPFAKDFVGYYQTKDYKALQKCDAYVDYIAGLY